VKKNPPSSRKSKTTLDQPEWDFSACPIEEVIECCLYEYARSSTHVRENAKEGLRTVVKQKGKLRYLRLANGYGLNLDYTGFPNIGWLAIPSSSRKKVVTKEFEFRETAFSEAVDRSLGFRSQTGEEVCLIEIAWGNTPERIVEDFTKWVRRNHASRQASITEKDVIWPQRLGSTAKKLLKALAAWRLLKVMKWDKAAELTEKLCGKPLFENQSAWLRAKKEAEQLLFGSPKTE